MALRNIGGVPVYSIDVEVPKPTDSRGRGYGLMVSDLRWKLWEEVKDSQLQQMKFDQLAYDAQVDILKQQQQDVSRAIREAQMAKAKVASGESSRSKAIKDYTSLAKAAGYTETTESPPTFMGMRAIGENIVTKKTRTPNVRFPGEVVSQAAAAAEGGAEDVPSAEMVYDPGALNAYITELEKRQADLETQFAGLSVPRGGNILDRTREAYQTQIGEGGFGIAPRRLRELPRFDETAAVGALQPMVDVKSRMNELQMLFPEDYKNLPEWSNLSNKFDKMQQVVSEARPVSSRQFLRKQLPEMPTYIPSSPERPPVTRGPLSVGVQSGGQFTREQELKNEIMRGGEPGREAALQSAERKERPVGSPVDEAINRSVELEMLGVEDKPWYPAAKAAADKQVDQAIRYEAEQAPSSPTYPIEVAGGLPTEMSGLGKPGGILDTARYLRQKRLEANAPVTPTPTPAPVQSGGSVGMLDESGNPIDLFGGLKEELQQRKQAEESMKALQGAVPETAPVITPKTGIQKIQEEAKKRKEEQDAMKALQEAMPQAKATPQSRSDLYAMRVTKSGLELAQKPAKLARLAKSDLPANEREKVAPEWILTVDKLYNVNKGKPNAFKLTYDEIAKTYRNDPKLREQAQSYLIAKDTLESQVSAPLA